MTIFASHMTDLELIVGDMESRDTGFFTREDDGSAESQASAQIAKVMADYNIQSMVYKRWWLACRISNRKDERPFLHIRPQPILHVIDHR